MSLWHNISREEISLSDLQLELVIHTHNQTFTNQENKWTPGLEFDNFFTTDKDIELRQLLQKALYMKVEFDTL